MDAIPQPRRAGRHDLGLGFAIACAVPLAWVVEWMALSLVRGGGDSKAWLVLALFAVPTLIAVAAIAKSMAAWSSRARWIVALVLLLAPPALLLVFGAFHG